MRGMNKVLLMGNATRDAELCQTTTGKSVANIRLATNRNVRSKGERREEAEFHSVICWDTLAETVSRYVKKGDPLYVEGRISYRTYEDSDGQKRGVTEVVASDVQFLGKRLETISEPAPDSHDTTAAIEEVEPDDIPF